MGYSVRIVSNVSNEIVRLPERVKLVCGSYAVGGTEFCELCVTYNYSPIWRELFGENGLNRLNGIEIGEARRMLRDASDRLMSEGRRSSRLRTTGNAPRAMSNGRLRI
jgi:hypothetical protein